MGSAKKSTTLKKEEKNLKITFSSGGTGSTDVDCVVVDLISLDGVAVGRV